MGPAAALVLLWACFVQPTPAQLIINVRNAGGDLLRERLLANTSDETITLEFQRADGTHVTQLIDFRAELHMNVTAVIRNKNHGMHIRTAASMEGLSTITHSPVFFYIAYANFEVHNTIEGTGMAKDAYKMFLWCDNQIWTLEICTLEVKEVQVFRVVVLAEEEQGHREPQVLCFLIRFNRLGFISVDAMSKLRQRNPLAEREPEDDRGRELVQLDLSVDLSRAGLISPHVATLCADAPQATFARQGDMQAWAASPARQASGQDPLLLATAVRPAPGTTEAAAGLRCGALSHTTSGPCGCHLQLCVAWFPCGLKWCRDARRAAFRCGIRSCRKCREFRFPVTDRMQCLWDDASAS